MLPPAPETPLQMIKCGCSKYACKTSRSKYKTSADPEGGQGVRIPPGKSHVILVSIGYKQLDPPGKSWTPPWKMLDPLWNLEKKIVFFEIKHLTAVIS